MKFQLGPEIIASYKRLPYTAWYAFAEFIDNSTQGYINNKKKLDQAYKKEKTVLTVAISFGRDRKGDFIRIEDNSIGMSSDELQKAVIVGKIPQNASGRSKYGIGLKTAASWFGDYWTITTKKLGNEYEENITVDVPKIIMHKLTLRNTKRKKDRLEHYTHIEIRKLNHKIQGKSINKIKEYLSSMYRKDFSNFDLKLIFQGDRLAFDIERIRKRFLKNSLDEPYEKKISFKVNGKAVKGWVAIFEKGGRKDAGFTILQSNRVIKGFPDAYKPEIIFGDQEGGANNLISQRLVGEINLDGFGVSHTKDAILFSDDERETFESKLFEEVKDYRHIAQSYRKYKASQAAPSKTRINAAVNLFERELKSDQIKELISTFELPPTSLIQKNNQAIKDNIQRRFSPTLKTKINELEVYIYLVSDMSPNDPYVLIESTRSKKNVIIIINLSHPHWKQLQNRESILNFIRHCTYDGVSEWKTYFRINKIDPDTVKLFKDQLLRIPFEIEKHIN
ncbi:MAG TPA: ATP-binding protein [Chitinophagaceae bacterium]|jgi:hypothetical protein|nr:ATP-binding protein [Chitinophagaceae bacterium]